MQLEVNKVEGVLAEQAAKIIKQAKHDITGEEARAVVQALDWLTDLSKRIRGAALAEVAAPAKEPPPPETPAKGRAKK